MPNFAQIYVEYILRMQAQMVRNSAQILSEMVAQTLQQNCAKKLFIFEVEIFSYSLTQVTSIISFIIY